MLDNISLIIPTYKRNKYLLKIVSILNSQISFKKLFEIIIVDSSKNNFLKSLNLKNTRYINILQNSNALKGNIGIKNAKFKNIIFLDDDCLPSKTFLNDYKNLFKNLRKYFFFLRKNENVFIIKNKVKKILNLNPRYDNNFKKRIYLYRKKITNFIQNIE